MVPSLGGLGCPCLFRMAEMIGLAGDGGGKGNLNVFLGVLAGDGGKPAGYVVCHGLVSEKEVAGVALAELTASTATVPLVGGVSGGVSGGGRGGFDRSNTVEPPA